MFDRIQYNLNVLFFFGTITICNYKIYFNQIFVEIIVIIDILFKE